MPVYKNEPFVVFDMSSDLVRAGWPYRVSTVTETRVKLAEPYEDGTTPAAGIDNTLIVAFLSEESAKFIRDTYGNYSEDENVLRIRAGVARAKAAERVEVAVAQAGTKDTNPKEAIGQTKIPFHMIPDGPLAKVAMAFYEGGTKYGPYNWRVAGVRASTYKSAIERHIKKWWNGHDTDPQSRVHHLANAAAGLLILLDAEIQGKLNDDRPPYQNLEKLFVELEGVMAHLHELNKGKNPPNYTEKDYGNGR